LNVQTDYAYRILIYLLSLSVPCSEKVVTIGEIADVYDISEHHLNKVARKLVSLGILETRRGRGGGIRVTEAGREWRLGQLARAMEPECEFAQCTHDHGNCLIHRSCYLRGILARAGDAFYRTLDEYTVSELLGPHSQALKKSFRIGPSPPRE
jgi:Rrf2 family nitric oxide-sensitive transcriptional repressor